MGWKRRSLVIAVVLALLLVGWGALVERHLVDVQRHDVALPNLGRGWDGAEVAYLSDLQFGMWGANVDTAREMVARVVEQQPAVLLLGGDYLYGAEHVDSQLDEVVDVLRPVPEAGIPTFAVLGNHDLPQGAALHLIEALEEVGIEVLGNEAVPVPAQNGTDELYVVGVGPAEGGHDDPVGAVREVPEGAPRVVFMHHPDSFADLPADTAPLAVAGHTHGGQVQVPFTDWSPVELVMDVPVVGWSDDFGNDGNRLYVSRGVGFSIVPIRISCRPELTVFTLRGAP